MIAAWMLYCVGIGLAFVIVGHAMERALHLAGRPTRWAWAVALAGSFVVPAAAWLWPDSFRAVSVPAPEPIAYQPVADVGSPIVGEAAVAAPSAPSVLAPGDLDRPLTWSWALASAGLLAALTIAALRLAVLRRRWRARLVDGRLVLISDDVGPAVAGVWSPRIVIPAWALSLAGRQRELMLAHEEEHVRAGDPRLLALGVLALLLAPWNPALWWAMRRLRLAVEMDCDARVLARGGPAPEYGELLLQVGGRRTRLALSAAALGEPRSFLERRIRRMATSLPRWRWAGAAVAIAVAAGAVIGACEAPRPVNPGTALQERIDSAIPALQALIDSASPALQERMDSAIPALQARIDSAMAERTRPWVRENLERYYPDLLREQSGPPVDVWFGHDSRLQVSQAAWMRGAPGDINSERIRSVFWTFRPGNDAWSVVDRRALRGLVRDNVRVIMVHLGNQNRDLSAIDEHPEMLVLPWIRDGITRHYPALLSERSGPPVELWFVADPRKQVLRTVQRAGQDSIRVGIKEIHAVFPDLDETNVYGWRIAQGRGLGRLVRDNVRVIWIQLRDGRTVPPQEQGQGADQLFPESVVDERPQVLSGPPPHYPDLLRHAGIQGRVTVQAIIDRTGRAEPASVQIINSPHPGFDQSARNYVLQARFRPARVQGRAVRVQINLPLDYKTKA